LLVGAERTELLTVLAEDGDDLVRERAENAILAQPVASFVEALSGDAPAAQLFRYCGNQLIDKPEVASALAKHWRCPQQFLVAAAKRLTVSAVQEIMDNLDRLSATPALASALLQCPSLTAEQRQQIQELVDNNTARAEAYADAGASEIDPERRATLLQRLAKLRVAERVQLALKGDKEVRIALIRDPCKVVQRAVLQSSRITDSEVEIFASMTSLTDDVLRLIAANRNFRRNYTVVKNLITNPKTPLDVSLHFLPGMTAKDLKALTTNKNIPDTLRTSALRLHRQRNEKRE
jgi:hypothetical protein